MSELSFSSYVETIRPFLMKHAAKDDAAMFFLDSVSKQIPAEEIEDLQSACFNTG